jgi:hypothetical protein
MNQIWGIVLIIFGLPAWLGQTIALLSPKIAQKLSLTETKADVDPAFWADVRGEALWDTLTLWILPAAGILLLLNSSTWVYLGLVGGGMYLYFAGRGIFQRLSMQRRNIRIGSPKSLQGVYVFLSLWGIVALVTIIMAIAAVSVPD